MNKYKKQSRSRSRSKSPSHRKRDRKDNDRSKNRQRYQRSPKKYKRRHSSSSESSSSKNHSKSDSRSRNSSRQKIASQKNIGRQQKPAQPKYKIEETKVLKIEGCDNIQAAQRCLIDASISATTSMPDEVLLKDGCIFAYYPSIQVTIAVKQKIKQSITIQGTNYRINYFPLKKIDLNAVYDWYCDKCDYKNYPRRNKCYRCDNQKNPNCKINYNSAPATQKNKTQDVINNCSLMVRGPVITEIEEQTLLRVFEGICQIKDIRMIKNKMTGLMKDFAFIEFFTPEDAAKALKIGGSTDFRISGEKVTVMYSRNKSDDDYAKPLPYQKRQRRRDFSKKQRKDEPVESYYSRQRQLQIQQQKLRPLITLQQLKQKRQQQLRKNAPVKRQLTQQQAKRRKAELMAKQWEKQAKLQSLIIHVCVFCKRKFKNQAEMKMHESSSELHKYNKQKFELSIRSSETNVQEG